MDAAEFAASIIVNSVFLSPWTMTITADLSEDYFAHIAIEGSSEDIERLVEKNSYLLAHDIYKDLIPDG